MEWFADNWPVLLVVLALLMVFMGVIRKLVKLAFIGVVVGAIGLVIWPMIAT